MNLMKTTFFKKIFCLTTALCCLAAPCTAFAAEAPTETSTEFSYEKANEPSFTVSIPAALTLSDEGTPLDITASDVFCPGDQKISVTIAGTNYYRNQMVMVGETSKPSYSKALRYQLISPDGTVIETTGSDTVSGMEIASFTDNGTVTYTVKPVIDAKGVNLEPGVSYKGTMTFGIGLTEN